MLIALCQEFLHILGLHDPCGSELDFSDDQSVGLSFLIAGHMVVNLAALAPCSAWLL
jgi:hypothetical protein